MLPVMTRYLTPLDYGTVAIFAVLIGFLSPFIGLSTVGAIARQYYEKNSVDLPKYITNCLMIFLVTLAIVTTVFLLFSGQIENLVIFPRNWFLAVIIVSASQFIIQLVLVLWQVQVKSISYGSFQILQTLFNVGLSVWLVVGFGMNWQGRLLGQVFAISAFGVFGMVILWKDGWLKLEFDLGYIKHAVKFGAPLIFHSFGGWIMTAIDRLFINKIVGVADTGIYVVGYQVGAVIYLLVSSFNIAWVPWFYAKLKQDDPSIKLKIVKFTYLYGFGIIFIAIALSLIAPWFLSFFVGKAFLGSSRIVVWIAMAYAVKGMHMMAVNYLYYVQRTYLIACITFSSALLHIIISYLFISANGAIGAAQATTISFFFLFVATWIIAARVYRMPWILNLNLFKE